MSATANGVSRNVKQQEVVTSKKYDAFNKHYNSLQLGLSSSILPIAQRCRARKLISRNVYDELFGGRWTQEQHRSLYFLNCICKRLCSIEESGDMDKKVKEEIKKLAGVVGKDGALSDTAKVIGKG